MRGKDVGADGVRLFTRTQAAAFLGLSLSTLVDWHRNGKLPADRRIQGVHVYTRATLEEHARSTNRCNGVLAAEVFQRLELGTNAVAIVIELRADPLEVERLVASYQSLTGGWIVAGPKGPRKVWEESYQLGTLTPAKLRRALELCASDDQLRAKLLADDA